MSIAISDPHRTAAVKADPLLRAVLSGSFRRFPNELRFTYEGLRSRFEVLSPGSVDFVDLREEFVRLPGESAEPVREVEERHLVALKAADFVWLFCPTGYVGRSASLEVGYAHALGVPVFAEMVPADPVVAGLVTVVDSMDAVSRYWKNQPGPDLGRLQRYYARAAEERGWSDETAEETISLLLGEVNELSEALRREAEGSSQELKQGSSTADELADIQLYLLHLANRLGIDLVDAVQQKERLNEERFARNSDAA